MNKRIYVSQKIGFDVKTNQVKNQLQQLNIFAEIKSYTAYDIFDITESEFDSSLTKIFCDKVSEEYHLELPKHEKIFAIEYLPGQYDMRSDASMQCCQLLFEHNNVYIQTSQVIGIDNINNDDFLKIKNFLINTVDSKEKDLLKLKKPPISNPTEVEEYNGFIHLNILQLHSFLVDKNLSIDIEDLKFIQQYFIEENRDPTETEIRVLDTYWSDHCRHTTFLTEIEDLEIKGDYKFEIESTLKKYLQSKKELNRDNKPLTLMDLGTLPAKYLHKKGYLKEWHLSKENNAATIEVDINNEKWLILFKNETHNHPTEIEPFGGASTCIGGAIRDPLSGRAYVYQAMRLSGSSNPLEPIEKTIDGKLSQYKISKESTLGYSSYGNQIGLATSLVNEIFDEGYKAKRFECGFVVASTKKENVIEEEPIEGDIILLLGGKTGRDGIGGASGSSKQHNIESLNTMQAEVQKGNALVERRIQVLFRKPEVTKMIKKCNDFGAGGICVAIGEISNSVEIYLNNVPLKYTGLNGTEIALSESQERMAVVVSKDDVQSFIKMSTEENVQATPIAVITNDGMLRMNWNNKQIVKLKRTFLNTNGTNKKTNAIIEINESEEKSIEFSKENYLKTISSKEVASQKGMIEHFDSTVYGNTCLMPFGGKYQLTPSDVSAHYINPKSNTLTVSSWGYHPKTTIKNTYTGSMYSIIESVSKLVSCGCDYRKCYLTFQEYYERLKTPNQWGKPLSSLLGAFETQLQLGIAAIGGKDSMSGTFNDINVPPTFVSFAISTMDSENIISAELKNQNSYIYLHRLDKNEKGIPEWNSLKGNWSKITKLISDKKIISALNVKDGGISSCLSKMSFGNKIGFEISTNLDLFETMIGSIIFEATEEIDGFIFLGKTNKNKVLKFNDVEIDIEESISHWSNTFESIFPTKSDISKVSLKIDVPKKITKNIGFGKPKIIMPVFNGTNCEFETKEAFESEGGIVEVINFNTLNEKLIKESILKISKSINESQILMFSGGFSAGDEPDGSAKYIVNTLKNKYIYDSVKKLLDKGGLILGICNGFQGLIKSGLLPYGEIQETTIDSPTLTYNTIGRHISQMVNIKVVNDNSPWLQGMKDKIFTIPVSHGEGRFYSSDKTLNNLINKNQIVTQYVDLDGNPSGEFPFNPNGSIEAIEGVISEDGRIFGRMCHPERFRKGRFKNIPNIEYHNIFENGVKYFL